MMRRQAIPAEQLRWQLNHRLLPGESTREIPVLDGTLGQETAAEALRYGIAAPGHNQHIFVRGPHDSGRHRLLSSVFNSARPKPRQTRDYCFVHNFANPDRPRLIILPPGEGRPFQKQMHRIALFIRERLPEILENDPIRGRREARREAAERDVRLLLRPLEKRLDGDGLALVRSQAGPNARLQIAVKIMGKPVSLEEFRNMVARKQATDDDRKQIEDRIKTYEDDLHKVSRQIRQKWQQAHKHIEQIDITETARILGEMTAEISQRFKAPGIDAFLREVIDDVLEKRIGHETSQLADPTVLYAVNVLNTAPRTDRAPLVSAGVVAAGTLFGTVDPTWRSGGRAVASFHGIRSGAIIQADGGFLVLDAEELFANPEVFRHLLQILRTGEVEIMTQDADAGLATQSLRPEPVPIDVSIILVGDNDAYRRLESLSPEFNRRFRILADLADTIAHDESGIERTCRLMSALVQEESILPLGRPALTAVLEYSARLADRPGRLTTRAGRLSELVREASFLAASEDDSEIGREHVEQAASRIRQRAGVACLEQIQLDVDTGRVRLRGRSSARINVVPCQRNAAETQALPVCVSAIIKRHSAPEVSLLLDTKPQPDLAAPWLLVALAELLHFDRLRPIQATLQATGLTETSDLPSTLLGQACCLIATLAEIPLRQDLAVIGSLDAHGQPEPVAFVNERIEGFFEACQLTALNGQQGTIIPAANADVLNLDRRIIKACTNDQFHIYRANSVSDVLELLTDKPAGKWKNGAFPDDSVLGLARANID
ncbi:MAG: AAA family ATPase [Pseudomonadota bacterium]|nr:MAG: AAA family ATPase [Pseudomonadota bacterium]